MSKELKLLMLVLGYGMFGSYENECHDCYYSRYHKLTKPIKRPFYSLLSPLGRTIIHNYYQFPLKTYDISNINCQD